VTIPNILTVLRIFLTVIFVFCLYQGGIGSTIWALVVFTLASLTDYFDGYLARKYNWISSFGKIMDPIADKFLTLSAFFVFMQMNLIATWMFVVICIREVVVTGLRLPALQRGVALAAEGAGKLKTVLQIVLVYSIMIFIVLLHLDPDVERYSTLMLYFSKGIYLFMIVVVLITVWSGASFIWKNRKEMFNV